MEHRDLDFRNLFEILLEFWVSFEVGSVVLGDSIDVLGYFEA